MKCSALCNRKFCELFLHALWLVIIPTGKEGKTEQVVKDRRCDEDGKVPGHVKDRRKQAETQRRLIAKTPNIGGSEHGSICAMKSVPGRAIQNNGLSFLSRDGDIIMKTVSFGITD